MSFRIPIKTEQGLAELVPGQRKLSQRHRSVLFCVDGKRTESQVRQMAAQAGAPPECFDELLSEGFIRFLEAKSAAGSVFVAGVDKVDIALPMHEPEPANNAPSSSLPAAAPQPTRAAPGQGAKKVSSVPKKADQRPASPPAPLGPPRNVRLPDAHISDHAPLKTEEKLDSDTFHVVPSTDSTGFDSLSDISSSSLFPTPSVGSSHAEARKTSPIPFAQTGPANLVDGSLEDARQILVHLVKTESPVAGEPTLLHLNRVQTRAEMLTLLPEVEWRISKPHRALTIAHTMRLVRQLLSDDDADFSGLEED
jgi:hypothetical protein